MESKKFKAEDLKGKFLIGFDTICDGNQTSGNDEDGKPHLYDSYNEAFKEVFIDAIEGIKGNEEYFMDDDGYDLDDPKDEKREAKDQKNRDKIISDMRAIFKEDDIEKMKAYFQKKPDANYYDEFVEKADEFILGRKTMWSPATGVTIEGTKLEDI